MNTRKREQEAQLRHVQQRLGSPPVSRPFAAEFIKMFGTQDAVIDRFNTARRIARCNTEFTLDRVHRPK